MLLSHLWNSGIGHFVFLLRTFLVLLSWSKLQCSCSISGRIIVLVLFIRTWGLVMLLITLIVRLSSHPFAPRLLDIAVKINQFRTLSHYHILSLSCRPINHFRLVVSLLQSRLILLFCPCSSWSVPILPETLVLHFLTCIIDFCRRRIHRCINSILKIFSSRPL